jgi:hypothetical protein
MYPISGEEMNRIKPDVSTWSVHRLRHGNAARDLRTLPKCLAKTRQGKLCQQPAMSNGRCRFHGGKSTGPKTAAGLALSRRANYKHGFYSQEAKQERKAMAQWMHEARQSLTFWD